MEMEGTGDGEFTSALIAQFSGKPFVSVGF
jgi:hypothetical protein